VLRAVFVGDGGVSDSTAGSFVQYLIDTYGIEAYLRVHFDRGLFDEVYGRSLQEMIDEWVEFLGRNAEQLLLLARN